MWKWKRYVTGLNAEGKSCIIFNEASNVVEIGSLRAAELWYTDEMPIDNTGNEDRARRPNQHWPTRNGTIFRALIIPPEKDMSAETFGKLGDAMVKGLTKHPSMHRSDTIDYVVCISGEVWYLTEKDEVLMKPGDCLVTRGHNHGWVNRMETPCLLAVVLIDAKPF